MSCSEIKESENILNYYQRLAGAQNNFTLSLYVVAPGEIGKRAEVLRTAKKMPIH